MIESKRKTALFMGAFPDPVTGQSLALQKAWEGYSYEKYKINSYVKNQAALFIVAYCSILWKTITLFVFKKPTIVYISISRTLVGSLKDLPAIVLAKIYKIPVINHIQGADFQAFIQHIPSFLKPVYLYFYRSVAHYVVLTDGMQAEVINALGTKTAVSTIPNFYDSILNNFPVAELLETKNKNEYIEIVYLSNLLFTKGVIHLIDAFVALDTNPTSRIKLTLAGKIMGDSLVNEQELSQLLTEKIKNQPNITYVGIVSGKAKADLLAKTNIFILPTFYPTEAQPLSIIEALKMGCYVISTNHNYVPEFVNSTHGELIPSQSVHAIKTAISKYLLLNESQRTKIATGNVDYATAHFSLAQYQKSINHILNRHI